MKKITFKELLDDSTDLGRARLKQLQANFDEMVRSYAESKACFGWIQKASEDKWVYQLYSSDSRRKASKLLFCISSVGGRGEM